MKIYRAPSKPNTVPRPTSVLPPSDTRSAGELLAPAKHDADPQPAQGLAPANTRSASELLAPARPDADPRPTQALPPSDTRGAADLLASTKHGADPRPTQDLPPSDTRSAAELLQPIAPIPMRAYRERAGLPGKDDRPSLWSPRLTDSVWARRCRHQPELAWALGTVLEAFPETPVAEFVPSTVLTDRNLMGTLGGRELRLSSDGGCNLGVLVEGHGLITPGQTLEEKWADLMEDRAGLSHGVWLEVEHACNWLAADEALGLRLLLGPVPRRLYDNQTQKRRLTGYLDDHLFPTHAGWWRLSYGARQAIGAGDRRRQMLLRRMARHRADLPEGADPRGLRNKHLRATQAITMQMYREEKLYPIGVEMSPLADLIGRTYRIRADALMADRSGSRLVWVEVVRRPLRHMPLGRQQNYARKRDLMAEIGQIFKVDMEWRMYAPETTERFVVPWHRQDPADEILLAR